MLRKTDPKKNKYSVDVMADDKLTEKKDKSITFLPPTLNIRIEP